MDCYSTFIVLTVLQCVDKFVDELQWEENDSSKCDKIRELKLNTEEWGRVSTFLDLLSVGSSDCIINYHIQFYCSTPTTPSKHFHPTMSRPSITRSQPWKPFTRHGHLVLTARNMPDLPLHCMPHVQRSTATMKRQRIHLRTSWRWVRILFSLVGPC